MVGAGCLKRRRPKEASKRTSPQPSELGAAAAKAVMATNMKTHSAAQQPTTTYCGMETESEEGKMRSGVVGLIVAAGKA